jgi:hypothetical protein
MTVIISGKVTAQEMQRICTDLHRKDPRSFFEFYDSVEKIDLMSKLAILYPQESDSYPEKWANRHFIGILNKMCEKPGVFVWTFGPMSSYYTLNEQRFPNW